MKDIVLDTAWRGYRCPARENISFALTQKPCYIPLLNTLAYQQASTLPAPRCQHKHWTQHGQVISVRHIMIYHSQTKTLSHPSPEHFGLLTGLSLLGFLMSTQAVATAWRGYHCPACDISFVLTQKHCYIPLLNTLADRYDSAF